MRNSANHLQRWYRGNDSVVQVLLYVKHNIIGKWYFARIIILTCTSTFDKSSSPEEPVVQMSSELVIDSMSHIISEFKNTEVDPSMNPAPSIVSFVPPTRDPDEGDTDDTWAVRTKERRLLEFSLNRVSPKDPI